MRCHAACLAAAGLLTACATAKVNYTDALGPRYAGGAPTAGAPDGAASRADTLKVVAFNVEFAEHVDRAIALIRDTPALRRPDVLLLQEMDETGTAAMATALGLAYVYYPATLHPATDRDFGCAILSRYPISEDRKIVLPHLARPNRTLRVAVGATILVGGRRVRIYSLHLATFLDNGPRARRDQLAAVLADARPYGLVVLGGDFNSASVPEMALPLGFEWPTYHLGHTRSLWDVDHVLLKGLTVSADSGVGLVRHVRGASDHRPVWARVVLSPAPDGTPPATADTAVPLLVRKRPLRAVLEGVAINAAVNRWDDWIRNAWNEWEGYWSRVGPATWSANIRHGWSWDGDAFQTNMFSHPLHGALYFRAGRQNGLDFWESVPLPFLGSAEWEYFGETARPSLNDFYNTSFGGIVLGEMTFRLAALVRDNRARGTGRLLRELAAVPLDPVGSLKRLLAGDATRVYGNPADRDPSALAFTLQAGPRFAADSGIRGARVLAPSVVAELAYGDPFATSYVRPFDVFLARLQLDPGGHPVNDLVVSGRLYGHEFTNAKVTIRTIFTVNQKLQYSENPAYKFGGQMLDVGATTRISLGSDVELRLQGFLEGIMLGAVDAPEAGIRGTERTYDFGPGAGFEASASLFAEDFPVLTARWHGAVIHSVSGSSADHFTQLPSLEAGFRVTGSLGIGAYAAWYQRRSAYQGYPGEAVTYPDFRAYLVWSTHHDRPTAVRR
jgi:endonuclease/exonuclease/phosphatase family metal-dependent hydrolase